ncbi:MAG: putative O-glycosylation ligase, exosortase A system-associated [Sulfuricaulis sp.]|nr:putative O-glycosylation ligase, exosortase A system-associated [Sulfuricaulis sp.]
MRDYILVAIVLGSLPFILRRPFIGILLWCIFSYMNPHRFTYGFAYEFPFAAIIAGATIAGLLFSKESKRIPWNSLTIVWVLFILWMCLTTLFALIPQDAYTEWERSMKIQLMTFITIILMTTRARLNALVWAIVVSLGFFGIKGGVFTLHTGGQDMVWGPPGSFIEGNNSLGLALVMALPLMRYLQLNTASFLVRYGISAVMVLTVLSIFASYSRGAILAVAAMGLFLLFKSRKKGPIILMALVAVPLMLSFMPEEWFERLHTIKTYEQDASALGRINAWWFAFNVAVERPLVGGGFEVFDPELFQRYAPVPDDFHDAHSIYFQVLGEHGFVGLILFMLLGWLSFRSAAWVIRHTKEIAELTWARDLASMIQVSLIGYAVGGAFLGLAYFDLYYHLVAIALLIRAYVSREILAGEASFRPPGEKRALHEIEREGG